MSFRGRNKKEAGGKKLDITLEEVAGFLNFISACSGALLIVSLIAFFITGSNPKTNVIYVLVIGINAIAFITGRVFVKKYGNKE